MKLLLDTQIWIWIVEAPDRLPHSIRRLVSPSRAQCFLSAVSALEIAIKYRLGKLKLSADPSHLVPEWMARTDTAPLPVLHKHALRVGALPLHHHDPFDRLLIAQAQIENFTIVSIDRRFKSYEVKVLPA
jgi:PIN domain nuclease of toxin-antitoxin system